MAFRRSFSNTFRKYFSEIDVVLFATVVALSFFAIFNIYGIGGTHNPYFGKEVIFVFLGIALMVLFSFFNYRYFKNNSGVVLSFYILALILLVMPFFFHSIRGVKSWIVIGGFTIEPAELVKLMLVILLAKYFSQRHVLIDDF